ncbi:MAG: IPT/TIG domain-containing protein, partial [Acidobacteriaceae bacterium]
MRDFIRLWITLLTIAFAGCCNSHAAGVYKIAGSGFDSAVRGKPILWRNGVLRYWTDQGDLNANITGSDADQAVAWALQQWTQAPTAALSTQHAGVLVEDVSGANVSLWNGVLELPADAQAGANGEFLTVIYDNGGAITDLFYGAGASDPVECSTNAVISYIDSYASDGHFAHAVLVLNGNCFSSTAQLQFALLRKMGRLLGIGWSQVNDNVVTGIPTVTSADFAGYPRMHPLEGWCTDHCLYDSALRADDIAAVSRLYPVTAANIGEWPPSSKFLSRETTVRISGRVLFASGAGMQGVNVVARLIDPNTGQPSRMVAVSCVSGFLFHGNAGNPITGYTDAAGARLDRFGGDDPALAGYYEIAGLPLPPGQPQASYQISVEPVDPLYSGELVVGPYEWAGVTPSGSFMPVVIGAVGAGSDLPLDIAMQGSSAAPQFAGKDSRQVAPLSLPKSGMWVSSLGTYGHTDYFKFLARANRSFSVEVTAVDEAQHATQSKLAPALGAWNASDPAGSPAVVASAPFDSSATGVTWLNAVTSADDVVTVGIADMRGDGRPDYAYVARLFYADAALPARAPSGQGTITVLGKGFTAAATVAIGGVPAIVKSVSATRMVVALPALADGVYDIALRDSVTGAVAAMYQALQIGDAAATIVLLSPGASGTVALGSVSSQKLRVRVLASDGTPLAGEAVVFRASPATVALTACGGSVCNIFTDEAGEAQSGALIQSAGANTVTASLANGSAVFTTYNGAPMAYSVSALPAEQWI